MPEPLDILVLTDEPFHASYLASVLDLEAPGLFRVRHGGTPSRGRADLVIVQGGFSPADGRAPFAGRIAAACGAPVILVSRGGMDLPVLDRLMHEGADDVLDLGELSARGLAAAMLKAVCRRSRNAIGPGAVMLDAVPEPAA
ncbi:MAG TPA: hypothetical protein VJ874_04580 [Candidatus Thermoplasmatota archaeon]|nr:hypothetical protein [Candidatus Thermoplasmatota archaeon]